MAHNLQLLLSTLQTPGPGTYSVTDSSKYKTQVPHYSMTSRNNMPGDSTTKPGPGAHSPERVCNFVVSSYTYAEFCSILSAELIFTVTSQNQRYVIKLKICRMPQFIFSIKHYFELLQNIPHYWNQCVGYSAYLEWDQSKIVIVY